MRRCTQTLSSAKVGLHGPCRMPDVIEVKIQYAPNVLKTLLVAVVRDMQKKPFLGGFR